MPYAVLMATEIISKVSLAGESMVGKTSLISRFVLDQFDDKYLMTLGTKVSKKTLSLKDSAHGNVNLTLMVWDIVGLSGYHSQLHSAHFKGAKGALLVCDVTRFDTYECMSAWAEQIIKASGNIPLVFLGNKSDLDSQVTREDLEGIAKRYSTEYFLTSAKTGRNVQEAFEALGKRILKAQK